MPSPGPGADSPRRHAWACPGRPGAALAAGDPFRGAYAYGMEHRPEGLRPTFDLAFELVAAANLERLVSARYPLERFEEAVAHAAAAGRRGAVKVVFDLSPGRPARPAWRALARQRDRTGTVKTPAGRSEED